MLVLFLTWTIVAGAQQVSKSQMPQVKWTFSITQPLIASPVVNGNTVIFGGLDSTIYALDVSSGSLQWKFKTVGPVRSTAYVSDNQVFFSGGDGRVYCVDAISGKKLWTFATPGGILGERRYDAADYFDSSPVVSDTRVFVAPATEDFTALNDPRAASFGRLRLAISSTQPQCYWETIWHSDAPMVISIVSDKMMEG